jgi:Flp pilus assembly protein TadD
MEKSMANKGDSRGRLNKYDEAITAYDKAIEINPNDSDAWYNKGVALDNLNKFILPSNAIGLSGLHVLMLFITQRLF